MKILRNLEGGRAFPTAMAHSAPSLKTVIIRWVAVLAIQLTVPAGVWALDSPEEGASQSNSPGAASQAEQGKETAGSRQRQSQKPSPRQQGASASQGASSTPPPKPAPDTVSKQGASAAPPGGAGGNKPGGGSRQAAARNNAKQGAPAKPTGKEKAAKEAIEETPQPLEEQGILSQFLDDLVGQIRGKMKFQINQSYTNLESNQLFINGFGVLPLVVVGEVNVQRVRRNIFNTSLGVSYRFRDGLTGTFTLPFTFQFTRTSEAGGIIGKRAANTAGALDQTSKGAGLGDIAGSLSYMVKKAGLVSPAIFANLNLKFRSGTDIFEVRDSTLNPPTGSGFNTVGLGLSMTKLADPASLFASFGYDYAVPRKNVVFTPKRNGTPTLIDFTPGGIITLSGGMSYALNYKMSLTFGLQQTLTFPSKIDGNNLANSVTNSILMRVGGVWRYSRRTSIDLSFAQGLTIDAPNFQMSLRIPLRIPGLSKK